MSTDDEERQIEDWNDALEAIRDDLRFFKRLRGQGRYERIGHVEAIDTNSNLRPSGDESFESSSPNISRPTVGSPFSVNAASTLVPGLIALSTALAPATLSNPDLRDRG